MHIVLPVALALAGACALINVWLALRIGHRRVRGGISIGDGGDLDMATRMRTHANFAEYAPIVIILVGVIELAQGSAPWLWGAAALFVVARILHAVGMGRWLPARAAGATITLLLTLGLGLYAAAIPFLSFEPAPTPTIEGATPPA